MENMEHNKRKTGYNPDTGFKRYLVWVGAIGLLLTSVGLVWAGGSSIGTLQQKATQSERDRRDAQKDFNRLLDAANRIHSTQQNTNGKLEESIKALNNLLQIHDRDIRELRRR